MQIPGKKVKRGNNCGASNWARLKLMPGIRVAVLVVCVVTAIVASCSRAPKPLDIATTTSVQNSGLLEALLPHFPEATVRVHAAGSGRALAMLADGIVDLVISHAPETEARFLADHPTWTYRKIAYNRFVVVGPPADPARVRQADDVVDAFRRIAAARAIFVSRGDESGTHERERLLWKAAGLQPEQAQLRVSGQGMAVTLRQTDEQQGYTLSDEATFWQLEQQVGLVTLFDSDPRLLNTYAVVYPQTDDTAKRFAAWLAEGDGRERISAYRVQGRVAFTVWPGGCPAESATALPCDTPTRKTD
jgi:tungstate transport system substrate-binding protein